MKMYFINFLLIAVFVNVLKIFCLDKRTTWFNNNRYRFEDDYSNSSRNRHQRISIKVHIRTRRSMCLIDRRFLSFSIDALEMKRLFRCFPLLSNKINQLARALSPAYLRVGGTPQDFLTFNEASDNSVEKVFKHADTRSDIRRNDTCEPHFDNWRTMKPFKIPLQYFTAIAEFAKRNGLKLIFGLNALNHRNKATGAWNGFESLKIINHAHEKDLDVQWELGNEPNRYVKFGKKFIVSPSQLAEDYAKLRKISRGEKIVGPSVASNGNKSLRYLQLFLEHHPNIDAITYHHYFMHQSVSSIAAYLDPYYLDKLEEKMKVLKWMLNSTNTTSELWLGEAGTSSGGGERNLSNTYASGFLYLSTLGLASQHCHKVVIRQSFYGGYYGMLDAITNNPLPDFWTSVLFKRLVGKVSLKVHEKPGKGVQIYAYCSNENDMDVTIMAINILNEPAEIFIHRYKKHVVEKFVLTPESGDLKSNTILLNGKILSLRNSMAYANDKKHDNNILPDLSGVRTMQPFELPPKTYGFFVVKNVKAKACQIT